MWRRALAYGIIASSFLLTFCLLQPGFDSEAQAQTSGGGTNPVMSSTIDLTTADAVYMMPVINGQGVFGVDLTGLTGSGATIVTETTVNGTFWNTANMLVVGSAGAFTQSITADSSFRVNVAGKTWVRLRVLVAGGGTANVTGSLSTDSSIVQQSAPLPPGGNHVGSANIDNFPAVQPVSGAIISCANAPTTQVAIGTAAVQVVAARAGRYKATVAPTTSTVYYVGPAGVTTATGLPVLGGGSYTFYSALPLYAVSAVTMTLGETECY